MTQTIYTNNETIEIRRFISNGNSVMISVPKSWLKQNKLELRDRVEVKITGDKIVITNKRAKEEYEN
jgi:antitoxin component of MazEF toxin-antitoxin module